MDTGLFLALISAVIFAIGIVMVRKTAGDAGEAFTVTALSIFAGIPFFAIAVTAGGEWTKFVNISGKAAAMLASAGLIMAVMLLSPNRRRDFTRLSLKKNVAPMLIAGLFTAAGQLLYFAALSRSQANTVAPLVSIEILFIFILSFLVNRRSEVFTFRVALGMAAAIAGTFLLFL